MNSLLIEASAGSGKTFQLSNRFIALLALEQNPGDLIALTFTRKAAGEFARRILNRLATGASSEENAAKLANELRPTLIGDPATQQPGLIPPDHLPDLGLAHFRQMLQTLVSELDRLNLSTLDSFFTRLIHTYGGELGISGFEMLDEEAHKIEQEEVLASVLNGDQLTETQRELFLRSFELATYGKEELKVSENVLTFIRDHHGRFLQAPLPDAWGNLDFIWPDDPTCPEASPKIMANLAATIRENMPIATDKRQLTWLSEVAEAIAEYCPTLPLTDSKRIISLFEKAAPHLDDMRDGLGTLKHYKEFDLPPRLATALAEAIDIITKNEVFLCSKRTQGIWAVVAAFESKYHQQARSRGRVGFSDVAHLLQKNAILGKQNGYDQLAYRLDSNFRHWMLDEFQDTSRQQWDVIEPVISEAVIDPDHERSIFVVGDTKQAIYGWRSGEPRLISDMRERPDWPELQDWSMSVSYRSSQHVLDFVNLVCDPAGDAMRSLFPEAALARWRFENHKASKNLTGYAAVYEFPKKSDDDIEGSAAHIAALAVLEQIRPVERGLTCAILVGSNKQVRQVASFLRQHSQWPIETEAAVPVSADSPLGLALLDWFRFLVHPGDEFARRHIELSPLMSALNDLGESTSQAWYQARKEISTEGVATHLTRIARKLRSSVELGDFQDLRLQQILDAAREFDKKGGKIEDWFKRLQHLTRSEASKQGSIQVMTVHKSKGLEFDLVLLPELDSKNFDNATSMPMLVQENTRHLPEHFLLRPNKEIINADPKLRSLRDAWVADNCFERFCNLYVALTRAARAVIAFIPEKSQSSEDNEYKLNPSGWLRASVGDIDATSCTLGESLPTELTRLYQTGEEHWYSQHPIRAKDTAEAEITPISLTPATPRGQRRTASGQKSNTTTAAGSSRDSRSAMAFGNEVHALFESIIRWEGQTLPDTYAGNLVTSCLNLPASKPWFRPDENVEILNEQAIEAIDPDGAWFSGIIDRLLIHRAADGTTTKIQILDYKTDSTNTPEELITRYRPQLTAYAHQLAAAENLPLHKVETYILSTKYQCFVQIL